MAETGSIWRNRDVALLTVGTTVNGIGDWLLELALPLYVFIETGSGTATAAVYLINLAVGVIAGPFGGSLADRWKLRSTLIGTNVAQIVALAPLLFVESGRIWPVYLVAVLQGLISTVNDPASFALLPRLVSDEQLVTANSAMSAGGSIARLIGAAAGGIAIAGGGLTAVAIVDASTFAVGAITAWMLSPIADQQATGGDDDAVDSSVRAGLSEMRSNPSIAALVGIQGLAMIGFGAFPVLFIVFVTEELGGGGTEVGVIRASSAFGGLLAAAVIGRFAARHHPARVMVVGYLGFAAVAFAFVNAPPVTTALAVYLVLFAASGFPNVATQVGSRATAQLVCPPAVLGGLGGLMSAASALGMASGAIAAGLLLGPLTARTLFNAQVAVLLACGLIGYAFVARPLLRAEESGGTPVVR